MTRLCGGTFFTLLANASRPSTRKPVEFMGVSHTVSAPFRLIALLMILNPEFRVYSAASFSKLTSNYRNCEKISYGSDLPLNDSTYTSAFHERILFDYPYVLRDMKEFCDAFIDPAKMEWLAKALIETIAGDNEILGKMYIREDGKPSSVTEIAEMDRICLPALLAGCWDYIVNNVPDNTVGKSTLRHWCYEKESPNEQARLREGIGSSVSQSIIVSVEVPPVPERKTDKRKEKPYSEVKKQEEKPQEKVYEEKAQTIQPGNTVNYYYGTVNNFNGPAMVNEGIGVLELLQLDREYYNLFVVANEQFMTRSFMLSKSASLGMCIDKEVRERFLGLTAEDVAKLTHIPAIFAVPNEKYKSSERQAILGRLTDIRIQGQCVRFSWKPYCFIPQRILNENEKVFDIWSAPASNELDDEHWSIKDVSLLDAMNSIGYNPLRYVS